MSIEPETGATVIDFAEAAAARLDRNSISPQAARHIIEILKHAGKFPVPERLISSPPPPNAVPLNGTPEAVYYMLLLKNSAVIRWDGQGEQPSGMWVNAMHPKVLEAIDIMRAYPSIFENQTPGIMVDLFALVWRDAPDERRRMIISYILLDERIRKWVTCGGRNPAPKDGPFLGIDHPEIYSYLPDDWKQYITEYQAAFEQAHPSDPQASTGE